MIEHSLHYSGVPNISLSPSICFSTIPSPSISFTSNFGGFAATVTTANFSNFFFAVHRNYCDDKGK